MMRQDSIVDYPAIGLRIRTARQASGLTQLELAARVGISCAFVGHLERGEKIPSVETLARLACALEISLDRLVLGRERADSTLYRALAQLLEQHQPTSDDRQPSGCEAWEEAAVSP